MAATQAQNTIHPLDVPTPLVSAETRARLAQERKRIAADPSRQSIPAELTFAAKHVYRTKAGTYRRVLHRLPMPPEEASAGDEKQHNFSLRRWKAGVAHKRYPDLDREAAAKKLTAELEAVRDALGDTRFKFTHVPRHQECYFATNDDVIGAYIDDLIERGVGEFAQIYKQAGNARVVVGFGTAQAEAFPNTEGGWRLARQYMAEYGIDDIKLIED